MSLSPALDLVLRYVPSVPYLWGKFKFTTDQAAPLASPYTEGGAVGSLTLVDTTNKLSTSGGVLLMSAVGPGLADPGWVSPGIARAAGRALLFSAAWSGGPNFEIGWQTSGSPSFGGAAQFKVNLGVEEGGVLVSMSLSGYTRFAQVLRNTGTFHLASADGVTWTLLWPGLAFTSATMYANFACGNGSGTVSVDNLRVADLPAPWNSDYGIATQRLAGARSAGDTGTHTADCLIEWTETTIPSASTTDFRFRVQDSTNYWQITISSTGAITLNEVVAGTPTSRGTSAAAVANGNRVVVIAAVAVIKVYVANALKITYSSASNFATATSFSLTALGTSEAISDMVAWPRTVTIGSQY